MSLLISKPCQCRDERQERVVLVGLREIVEFNPRSTWVGLIVIGLVIGFMTIALALYAMVNKFVLFLFLIVVSRVMYKLVPLVAIGCPKCNHLHHIEFAYSVPDYWHPDEFPESICQKCGYYLGGVRHSLCPECGESVPDQWRDQNVA